MKKVLNIASRLSGDCSGLRGDCSGLRGNLDDCELSADERSRGVYIKCLIASSEECDK